jgi:hypothetical protein
MAQVLHTRLGILTTCATLGVAWAGCGGSQLGQDPNTKGSSGGAMATGGGSSYDRTACLVCGASKCPTQASTCASTDGCPGLLSCTLGCSLTDSSCTSSCGAGSNADASSAAQAYAACAFLQCPAACIPSLSGSGGGSGAGGSDTTVGGSGGSTGGMAPSTGGTAPSTGGMAPSTGGMAPSTGGVASSTGGMAPTGGTGGLVSGVNWLTISEDWADPADAPNGALNISGALYAYGDSCASLTWNPVTRCASGTLCTPGASYQNWGVAVGFDFHNTGANGTPPDTKMTWNPATVGAVGVAWSVSGAAPGLQLWMLQMDPVWNGQCSAASCEIAGPPDGTPTPTLQGQLRFTNVVKDDWGGSGTNYVFNPAAMQSLQFKLPAVVAGGQSFSFCVDKIGIVLP